MLVDNIEKISNLLKFKENTYYFIQVIQRKKENPDLPKSELQRGFWYITSKKDLEIHLPRIILTCNLYNARAYISLIPRSLEKLGKKCLLEFSKRVLNNSYTNIFSIPQKSALSDETRMPGIFPKPYWMIDIDSKDSTYIDNIILYLKSLKIIIVEKLDTPNGIHIIIEAFNPKLIEDLRIIRARDDYKLNTGEEFTLRNECNTILYSAHSDKNP